MTCPQGLTCVYYKRIMSVNADSLTELHERGIMAKEKLITMNIDQETRERLGKISKANKRSMTNQVRWLVLQEYTRLFVVSDAKLVDLGETAAPVEGAASYPIVGVITGE